MKEKTVVRLSVETIISIHAELINEIGGLNGVRDEHLLDMSVNSPFQTFGGDLYPTLVDKAAHLTFSLIKNHPFLDGNKRIGVTTKNWIKIHTLQTKPPSFRGL
jgi:death-on-curing protein